MYQAILTALFGSFAVSAVGTWLVRAWARRVEFVDRPGGHKLHARPVAQGGGIAVFLAIYSLILGGTLVAYGLHAWGQSELVPALLRPHLPGIASKLPQVLAITGGAFVLHIIGLVDDRRAMGPGPKFAAEGLVAVLLVVVFRMRAFEFLGEALSIVLSVLWIVAITNAFNFLDNMDGLAAGVAAIVAMVFAIASAAAGQLFVPVMAWIVVGAMLGFLLFNFSPASIFMGDAGSLVIGYTMSLLTILVTFYDPRQGLTPFGVLMPVVVLAVPLYDTISVVVHRLRLRISPFRGDRRHFSHRLVRRGLPEPAAVLTIYLATAATSLPAILLARVDWTRGVLILLQCLCVVVMIAILEHTGFKANDQSPPGGSKT